MRLNQVKGPLTICSVQKGALSNLRAELYATPQGRREHQALEKRLLTANADEGAP